MLWFLLAPVSLRNLPSKLWRCKRELMVPSIPTQTWRLTILQTTRIRSTLNLKVNNVRLTARAAFQQIPDHIVLHAKCCPCRIQAWHQRYLARRLKPPLSSGRINQQAKRRDLIGQWKKCWKYWTSCCWSPSILRCLPQVANRWRPNRKTRKLSTYVGRN